MTNAPLSRRAVLRAGGLGAALGTLGPFLPVGEPRAVAAGEADPTLELADIQGNVLAGFNKDHQRLLFLRFAGFEVATAGDGAEALKLARTFRPDLVVLDVMMPDVDGFAVVRRMRENGQRIPVLFLTARDATEDKITGLTLGGDDYVTKPFSLEELVARVKAIFRRAEKAAAAGSSEASGKNKDTMDHGGLCLDLTTFTSPPKS
jgi:CheY-like chemotaxis protein